MSHLLEDSTSASPPSGPTSGPTAGWPLECLLTYKTLTLGMGRTWAFATGGHEGDLESGNWRAWLPDRLVPGD